MRSFVKVGFLGFVLAALYACGTKNGGSMACPPNESVSCNCPGTASPGAQVCLEDGSGYDKCVCDGAATTDVGATTSTSTSVSTSTSTGGATTTSSTGSGSSGAGGNKGACDTGAECAKCQASDCAIALCKNEKLACDMSADCSGLFNCVQSCNAMDPPCFNACVSQFPSGTQTLIAFFTCTACKPGPCASDCKGSLQCGM